jgi:hypothetical protein
MKKVVTAAIRHKNGSLHRGLHHDDIEAKSGKGERGFVLDDGQFVNRALAAKVAVAAGQVPKQIKSLKSEQLTSYADKKVKLKG